MSTAVSVESRIGRVEVTDELITAYLVDGRIISVPLAWSWRLSDATPAQRANWTLIGDGHGVHWPDVDEDLSADGLLNGRARTSSLHWQACSRSPGQQAMAADKPRSGQSQVESAFTRRSRLSADR